MHRSSSWLGIRLSGVCEKPGRICRSKRLSLDCFFLLACASAARIFSPYFLAWNRMRFFISVLSRSFSFRTGRPKPPKVSYTLDARAPFEELTILADLVGSCLSVFSVSILYELLKSFRSWLADRGRQKPIADVERTNYGTQTESTSLLPSKPQR